MRARATPILQGAYTQILEGAYLDRLRAEAPEGSGAPTGGEVPPEQPGAQALGLRQREQSPARREEAPSSAAASGETKKEETVPTSDKKGTGEENRPPLARRKRVKEEGSGSKDTPEPKGRDRAGSKEKAGVLVKEVTTEEKDKAVASDPQAFGLRPTSKPSTRDPRTPSRRACVSKRN